MGLLDILGLGWKPRKGMVYKYKRWHRRKNLIWRPSMQQGNPDPVPEGTRKQNLSKVYVIIGKTEYPGTFKVNEDICTLGIVSHKKVTKLYKTDTSNVKFSKKDTGTSRVHPQYGDTVNITHHYEYVAKVFDLTRLTEEKIPSKIVRRRGTAIVDSSKGILVASGKHKLFLLPGGGANKGENRKDAAIRELKEETGLKAKSCKYLFTYKESEDGRKIRNLHKVFLIKAEGYVEPNHHDVHHIAYWTPESDINISRTTKIIIDKYLKEFKNES